jgi:hypothetical protein
MTADKTVTEREAVEREREAFVTGILRANMKRPHDDFTLITNMNVAAEIAYPLPKVTRPRVAADPLGGGISWRVAAPDRIQWSGNASLGDGADWFNYPEIPPNSLVRAIYPTMARVEMMLDLLANPTEEVEAEA